MKIENTLLDGLKLIQLKRFEDTRGSFIKVFNESFFKENNLVTDFRESYFSVSNNAVVRGMHFQLPPHAHAKLVYVSNGSILDVVLDLRKGSESFGKYFTIKLTAREPIAVYIPVGFAHGFLSLEHNSIVTYMQNSCYDGDSDAGVKWDSFGLDWKVSNPIISERDLAFADFSKFNSPF